MDSLGDFLAALDLYVREFLLRSAGCDVIASASSPVLVKLPTRILSSVRSQKNRSANFSHALDAGRAAGRGCRPLDAGPRAIDSREFGPAALSLAPPVNVTAMLISHTSQARIIPLHSLPTSGK